jgi:predicted PurR-regulated permease PerM
MIFFSLLSTATSSIFYGIIVTAVIMAILYAVLKSLSKGIVQSVPFYITGIVLAILLIVQCSLMIGAIQAKDAVDSAKIYLNQLLEDKYGIISAQDSQKVMDAITDNFPIIGNFIDIADFSGHDISDLPEVMHESMINFLSSYIWHRVWWILGIIVIACIVVMLFDHKTISAYSNDTNDFLTGRNGGLQF